MKRVIPEILSEVDNFMQLANHEIESRFKFLEMLQSKSFFRFCYFPLFENLRRPARTSTTQGIFFCIQPKRKIVKMAMSEAICESRKQHFLHL